MDALDALQRSPFFEETDRSVLETLVPKFHRRRFPAGSYMFREGDPGQQLYVILEGEVKIARPGPRGAEVVFALLVPGDLFGELALLDENALRTADAVAVVPTKCMVLDRSALIAFLDSDRERVWRLIRFLSSYIRRKDDSFAEVAFLDIQGRVARKLLELASAHGDHAERGTRIRLRISQRTLAGMVAASRENVNRALSRFAALGDIAIDVGHITIRDAAALRRRAGS